MDTQTGKFVAHASGLGTVTEEMVIKRAKEIAVTKGRLGNNYTQNDMDEARRELVGFPEREPAKGETPDTGDWLGEAGDTGQKAPVRPARDEQTFGEDLVKQGVEEATHHQMLAGNQTRRDQDTK